MDLFVDEESNIIYDFWKRRVRARINDEKMKEILALEKAPYVFGTQRVPLEQNHYEAFDRHKISLVKIKNDPIKEIRPNSVLLDSGAFIEFDVLILATGFDISTGSFTQIDIRGVNDQKLADKWTQRTKSFLGMSIAGFPNMLYSYGPQSPSNTCNGPVCAEVHGNWIVDLLEHCKKKGEHRVETRALAEDDYTETGARFQKGTLFEGTESYPITN